jgi:hypothetical protein
MNELAENRFYRRTRADRPRRGRCLSAWCAVVVALLCLTACDTPDSHVARAKKLVTIPTAAAPQTTASQEVLDLRGADVESERYLPVLERMQRRQATIQRVLDKKPSEKK